MLKVLIIEDEVEIVSFLKPELSHEGYDVDTASDGREGFEKIEKENYDIVLLDIMLPGLNGIEVCRRVRKFSDIPIIMLTARDQIMDKVTGLDMGADDYLTYFYVWTSWNSKNKYCRYFIFVNKRNFFY